MRVGTACKRMLGLPGLGVQDVQLSPGEVLVVAPAALAGQALPGLWRLARGDGQGLAHQALAAS
jgi:hypothetical protein